MSRQQTFADRVATIEIDDHDAGQRIDNFLMRVCKGVPKSHVYRILRSGEVRVNKGRIDAAYRLQLGDLVRVPPIRVASNAADEADGAAASATSAAHVPTANFPILYEDAHLLVIDKPAGVAVHGGSGVSYGVIEQLRRTRPDERFLELVHRLDRETSGVLMLAKKRSALTHLHAQLRDNQTDKRYLVCVHGDWREPKRVVKAALHKYVNADGERRVTVHPDGQASHTIFSLLERFAGNSDDVGYALLEAQLKTGRTHQIRVHLAHLEMPIAGDDKYGDFALNKALARSGATPGIKRMFLHAARLRVTHPATGESIQFEASLPQECDRFLQQLRAQQAGSAQEKAGTQTLGGTQAAHEAQPRQKPQRTQK